MSVQVTLLESLSLSSGFPAAAIRFLLCFIAAYPQAFIYRLFIRQHKPWIHHLYSTACGLYLCYFVFGLDCIHSLINIIGMFLVLHLCGPTKETVIISFILNLGYLYLGFYCRVMDDFMIDWSVPHCMLCLRLIGLTWDYYDGNNYNNNELSEDMKTTAIRDPPSLLEILGFSFFYGSFLAGPQFPIKRYLAMVHGTLVDKGVSESSCVPEGLRRMGLGLLYTAMFGIFSPIFGPQHFTTSWFEEISFLHRLWFITWFGKLLFVKYIALFLLSEGICVIAGLGYNGKKPDGQPQWDGVANMKILRYESALSVLQIIQAFHLQTNQWIARYVYKRLKFLGNRMVSLACSCFFLAVWHGYMPGYYGLFFMQYAYIIFEKTVINTWQAMGGKTVYELPPVAQYIFIPVLYLIKQFMCSYGLIPLALLHFDKFYKVIRLTYYAPLIVVLGWDVIVYPIIVSPLIHKTARRGTANGVVGHKMKKIE